MNCNYETLVNEAIKALEKAFVRIPKNNRYAAAVITTKGNIYSAGNYFSSTFTLSVHAEQAALVHAAAHGEPFIKAIAIVSEEDLEHKKFCHPCGLCRQLIFENARLSKELVDVLMCNLKGEYKCVNIQDLVPFPWPDRPPSTEYKGSK